MESNMFRELINGRRLAIGLGFWMEDPAIIGLAVDAGFDFVLPHVHKNIDNVVRAAVAARIPHLVTMPKLSQEQDPSLANRALDSGADGVSFPRVPSKQQAEYIVRLCHRDTEPVIAVRIGTKEGLENAEEILSVPGIDMVSISPQDLSQSLGVRLDDSVITEAQRHIIKLAKSTGVTVLQTA